MTFKRNLVSPTAACGWAGAVRHTRKTATVKRCRVGHSPMCIMMMQLLYAFNRSFPTLFNHINLRDLPVATVNIFNRLYLSTQNGKKSCSRPRFWTFARSPHSTVATNEAQISMRGKSIGFISNDKGDKGDSIFA